MKKKTLIRLLLILLVTGINQSVTFVRSSGPQASQTNEIYYTGDLIVKDNEVYAIENETFRIKGNVFIYDEGKLIIRNSCVIIEDSWSNEFVVDLCDRGNIIVENSILERNWDVTLRLHNNAALQVINSFSNWRFIGEGGNNITVEVRSSKIQQLWLKSEVLATIIDSKIFFSIVLDFGPESKFSNITLSGLKPGENYTYMYLKWGSNTLSLKNTEVNAWHVGIREYFEKGNLTIINSDIGLVQPVFAERVNITGIKPGYFERRSLQRSIQGVINWDLTLINTTVHNWKLITLNDAYIENYKGLLNPWMDKTVIVINSEVGVDGRGSRYLKFVNSSVGGIRLRYLPLHAGGSGNLSIEFENSIIKDEMQIACRYAFIRGGILKFVRIYGTREEPLTLNDINFQKGILVREYPLIIKDESGNPASNAIVNIYDQSGELVWNGLADGQDRMAFNITFTKENYRKNWSLEVIINGTSFTKEVGFLTSTPIVLSLQEMKEEVNDDISYAEAIINWVERLGRTNNLDEAKDLLQRAKDKYLGGRLGEARKIVQKIVDLLWFKIDGNPSDWEGIMPLAVDPKGDATNASGDLKSLYSITDGRDLYLMMEIYDERPIPLMFSIDLDTDLDGKDDYAIRVEGISKFILIGHPQGPVIEAFSDKVVEAKIPLEYIGNPKVLGIRVYTHLGVHPNPGEVIDSTVVWNMLSRTSSLSMFVSPNELLLGEPINVSGYILPPHVNMTVILTYKMPSGTVLLRNATSKALGEFEDVFTPSMAGFWIVKASWNGDLDHEGTESSEVSFMVLKAKSSLSLSASGENLGKGEQIIVSGHINPPLAGIVVTLTFKRPDGSTFTEDVLTYSGGFFSYSLTPEDIGKWSVNAKWVGDENYEGASSPTLSFKVLKPAEFKVTDLTINPTEAEVEQTVTIRVKVTNVGEQNGSYTVDLKVNDITLDTRTVALEGGESMVVTFKLVGEKAGTFNVEVSGLKSAFTIKEPSLPWELYTTMTIAVALIILATLLYRRKRANFTKVHQVHRYL